MIKINLVSGTKSAASVEMSEFAALDMNQGDVQKQALIRILMFLIGPVILFMIENQIIPEKAAVLRAKQNLLQELTTKNAKAKGAVDQIKKFKESQTKLEAQINIIEGLRKDRMREVKILDVIQRDMPEKMWLTKIELRDAKLTVQGMVATDSELTAFMDILAHSVYLKDVNLVRANEKTIEGTLLKEFSVSAALEKPGGSTAPKTGGG